jgi:hypothetical protein
LWCLTPLSTIFQLYCGGPVFLWGETGDPVKTTHLSQITDNVISCWLSWSYDSWIYNYLCNQCLLPLTLWVRTPSVARCTRLILQHVLVYMYFLWCFIFFPLIFKICVQSHAFGFLKIDSPDIICLEGIQKSIQFYTEGTSPLQESGIRLDFRFGRKYMYTKMCCKMSDSQALGNYMRFVRP